MAEKSWFFDALNNDRLYSDEDWAAVFAALIPRDGVIAGRRDEGNVTYSGLTATVHPVLAWIQGYLYSLDAPMNLAIPAAHATYPRIDRVVLRLDRSDPERRIYAAIKPGTPSASPVPPALQRDAVVWEISLRQHTVPAGATAIAAQVDERPDPGLCGYIDLPPVPAERGIQAFAADPAQAPNGSGPATLPTWMSWIVNRIWRIVGKPNWWEDPSLNLEQIATNCPFIVLRSPNGTRYRLTVNDAGDLETTRL